MGKTVGSRFGQMLIKIQDLKFDPGIVFAICTNQLHLPKKTAAKGWNRYQRWALRKWNTDFRLEHSNRENRTTFLEVPLLLDVSHRNDPKSHGPFTF